MDQFACAWCTQGHESFSRTVAGWKQIINTAFANLQVESGSKERLFFKKDAYVNYIKDHWDVLCTGREKTATWWATVASAVYEADKIYEWYAALTLLSDR